MSPIAFICETPDEKLEDLQAISSILEGMGFEVLLAKDFCHPVGQKLITESLVPGDKVVLICNRKLPRSVFSRSLFDDNEFFSYAMEGEPRDLAVRINSEVNIGPTGRIVSPPPLQKVLVVGGGVAGVFTALDIAEQGYHVSLVERDPSIGGIMAALDKTFPTMDCSI